MTDYKANRSPIQIVGSIHIEEYVLKDTGWKFYGIGDEAMQMNRDD